MQFLDDNSDVNADAYANTRSMSEAKITLIGILSRENCITNGTYSLFCRIVTQFVGCGWQKMLNLACSREVREHTGYSETDSDIHGSIPCRQDVLRGLLKNPARDCCVGS